MKVRLAMHSVALLLFAVTTGCGDEQAPATPHFAILIDRSTGLQDKEGRACNALETILKKVVDTPGANKMSQGYVYMTGTKQMQSAQLLHSFKFSWKGGGGIEANPEEVAKGDLARDAAVSDAVNACRSRATEENFSPLWASLKGVADDMMKKCMPTDNCQIYYYTDLQEIAEPWLCTQIFGADAYGKSSGCPANAGRSKPKSSIVNGQKSLEWAADSVLPSTSADGIDIVVCGTDESTDGSASRMGPAVGQRRDQVWKSLFPDAKKFDVYRNCSML